MSTECSSEHGPTFGPSSRCDVEAASPKKQAKDSKHRLNFLGVVVLRFLDEILVDDQAI